MCNLVPRICTSHIYCHPSTRYNVHIITKTGSMTQIQNWGVQITWLFFYVHGKESSFTDQAVYCRRISGNSTSEQWRTQEFCSGGGFNKFSWGQRTERMGIWGR
jgi:hypothetical protein